ncbi:MAG: hypothetical protein LBQ02_01900 [Candidatus Nomurabacteria bacterium]|nr:hypothetical protein [Candidatus Nomurabacteria bacterium]
MAPEILWEIEAEFGRGAPLERSESFGLELRASLEPRPVTQEWLESDR